MEALMDWIKNRTVQKYAVIGFLGGSLLLISGIWLEFTKEHLPLEWWSFPYLHRAEPIVFMLDLAPILFAMMGGLLGSQYSLSATISKGKKEWEEIFDSFSDLVLITDIQGRILRCNHAFVDRLNTTFLFIVGKPLVQVFGLNDLEDFRNSQTEFFWLNRLYEVRTFPIGMQSAEQQNLFIMHDITERKQVEARLEKSETLFRALFDLSPDAVVVIDPHDPNVSWPIIDCNVSWHRSRTNCLFASVA